MATDKSFESVLDVRSILDLPTAFGQAPGQVAEDRFSGQVMVDGEPIDVESGEALYKGQIFKVGAEDSNGNRGVFDSKQKIIGNIMQDGDTSVFKAPSVSSINDTIFTLPDGRRMPKAVTPRMSRDGKPLTPNLDKITSMLSGDSEFDASALIGGTPKEYKEQLKAEALNKVINFFTGDEATSAAKNVTEVKDEQKKKLLSKVMSIFGGGS